MAASKYVWLQTVRRAFRRNKLLRRVTKDIGRCLTLEESPEALQMYTIKT